jgi:hypothetical protein
LTVGAPHRQAGVAAGLGCNPLQPRQDLHAGVQRDSGAAGWCDGPVWVAPWPLPRRAACWPVLSLVGASRIRIGGGRRRSGGLQLALQYKIRLDL